MTEIHIPTRDTDQDDGPRQLLAVHIDPDKISDDEDEDLETVAGEHWDGDEEFDPDEWELTRIPQDVASELGLDHGDTLEVHQEEILHHEEASMGKKAASPEHGIEPMPLLQAVIDGSVVDSNLRIHPEEQDARKEYTQIRVEDMGTPNLAWYLYKWLGANRVMHHLVNAGGEIESRKKKS